MTILYFLLGLTLIGAGFAAGWWAKDHERDVLRAADALTDDETGLGRYIPIPAALRPKPRDPPRIIYLNREGGRLFAGPDDAAENRSSLVRSTGRPHLDFAAFDGAGWRWTALLKCVRGAFSAYDVDVVDQRPVGTDDYIMAMIGGTDEPFAKKARAASAAEGDGDGDGDGHAHAAGVKSHPRTTGLAPFSGGVIAGAVVTIFSTQLGNEVRGVCETAAMEIAHAYGLDHTRHCRDYMTYKKRCGTRRFVDEDVPCGEHEDRTCENGRATQNSHGMLTDLLGPAR